MAFVAAHHPSSTPRAVEASADKLLHATQAAFQLLNPFAEAAGRGSPAALLEGDAHTAAAAAHAYGAERLPLGSRAVGSLLHPGEAAAAEAFARQAQRRMLASQGVRVAVTVHPCVQSFIYSQPTVFEAQTRAGGRQAAPRLGRPCMAVETPQPIPHAFARLHGQLRLPRAGRGTQGMGSRAACAASLPASTAALPCAGAAEWVVHCHVYLHWEYYQPGWASMRSPMSPLYSLKLKKGGAVAQVGCPAGRRPGNSRPVCPVLSTNHKTVVERSSDFAAFQRLPDVLCAEFLLLACWACVAAAVLQAMGLQGGGEGVVSGAELNEATLAAALEAAPQLLLDTYRRRGKPLSFAPDRWAAAPGLAKPCHRRVSGAGKWPCSLGPLPRHDLAFLLSHLAVPFACPHARPPYAAT